MEGSIKNILHIINALTPDGAENLLVNSLSNGGLQNYTNNVLVYFQKTSEIEKKIDKAVKVICLDYKGVFDLPRVLYKIRTIIRKYKIDIVHSHLNPTSLYTYLSCPKNVQQIHTMHTIYSMNTHTSKIKLFLERVIYLKRDTCNLIFLTDFAKDDFLKIVKFRGKNFVLNNFIDNGFFRKNANEYGSERTSLRVVAVGRLVTLKNFDYLLEVFTYLKDVEVYLDIFGAGDIAHYSQKIANTGVKVTMKGHCYHLEEELAKYDLFIMPSKYEGFGLAIFEAMAMGVPVMVSNIEPIKCIAKENVIYFELNNANAVAEIIRGILNKEIEINKLAKVAQLYAKETVRREIYIRKLLKIYNLV